MTRPLPNEMSAAAKPSSEALAEFAVDARLHGDEHAGDDGAGDGDR